MSHQLLKNENSKGDDRAQIIRILIYNYFLFQIMTSVQRRQIYVVKEPARTKMDRMIAIALKDTITNRDQIDRIVLVRM